jgi:hypothetical protein
MDISDRTRVPLFAVLAALPIIAGFIFWLSTIYAMAASAVDANVAQDVKIEQTRELLLDIRDRIIRIEEKLSHER